ncbi:PHP domain-containing protein [Spirulina sp. 06S082]|uniref:PHP domain-containing protein n=1 Tax=Spirulina sp. 06S082 TaxID=3110248 RepID=UPI002B2014B6|nr:PHP domain-containing protein [Spirulina sp. 06S082]MEA5470988.1 PHP domain-containing protein [Spirulina sp. 06S082]
MMATKIASAFVKQNPQDERSLKEVWTNIQPDSCPTHYNFHLHTVFSDGQLQPQEVIEQVVAIGLQGLAITDHHTVDGFRIAQQYLAEMDSSAKIPQLWTGVEITSLLLTVDVHILGYAFDPSCPALLPYLTGSAPKGKAAQADRVIDAIHQAGGLAVLAHPERYRRSANKLVPTAVKLGIDGVETYYAYRHVDPWQPSSKQTQQVKQLSDRYGLFNTCGTDTHGKDLLLRR